ncbi:MAG TPA: zinc-binding alcohol dehydrogenase family protein [Thermoleophilaceae bacterium]|nr:zinc-binding alcohol dehydrogenase family protein [Thermoleophilaceae bacterium]
MRAAVVEAVGLPPVPADVDEPVRRDGSALVEVEAAPLNPVEIRVAAGRHPRVAQPPYVPGLEGAGRVVESARVPSGRRVRFEGPALPGFGAQGTLAQRAAVPEESLVELPDEADEDLAAALGVVGITALLALDRAVPVDDRRVLVLGATGAVGQMAVQLAKLMGAGRVVGAGRSSERLGRVRELGADEVVELGEGDLTDAFERAAGGPLDIVIDPLWGEPAMAALRAIATEGRLVNVGQSAGADVRVPLENVRNRQGAIHAISSGWTPLERKAESYRRVLELALAGRLTVEREVVPLDDVAGAWERQDGSPGKKLVVSIGQA